MRYNDYFNAVADRYPERRFPEILQYTSWNKVDLVKKVAELLFIYSEVDSLIANETRKQLISLTKRGVLSFD